MAGPERTPVDPVDIVIASARGPVAARFHDADPARGAILCVGGFDGGFDGPAEGLYRDLGDVLPPLGITVLRLDFRVKRSPGPIDDGTADVLAGIDWLAQQNRTPVALVGHSYGGAIVVRAAVRSQHVCGVAALSTQTAGIEEVARLAPRPLLLIHGLADWRLPPQLSQQVHQMADEPKTLHMLEGATHSLRQQAQTVRTLLIDWLENVLPAVESR